LKIKRTKQDAIFSLCVRERYNWTCCKCSRYFPEDEGRRYLHCSHIFSRRHVRTRHMPENAVAHCFQCHEWFGGNPVLGADWAREFLGNYVVDMLIEKHHEVCKLTKHDKEEKLRHFESEYARLLKARAAGATGILHLVGYE